MNSEISNVIDMNKRDLEKLSKAEFIKMVKKLQKKAKKPKIVIVDDDYKPVPPPRTYKPIPAPSTNKTIKKPIPEPSKSVKQMVNEYEDLILPPPPQFRDEYKPVPAPRTNETIKKPVPKQCKIVKQMVNEYEDLILPPPLQFKDGCKPVPAPRTDKSQKQPRRLPPGGPKTGHFISRWQSELVVQENQKAQKPIRRPPKPQRSPPPPPPPPKKSMKTQLQFRDDKPLQEPDSITDKPSPKIKELNRALKGHAKLYEIEIQDNLNPLNHFTKTKVLVESHLKDLLKIMKGYKFIETLEVTFKRETSNSKTENIYKTAFFNGKANTITNTNEIESELSISQQGILNTIEIWISEGSGWTIDKIDSNYINIVTYQPLNGSSYIDQPDELENSKKGLINIKNKDNKCFRWCHVRHLNPQEKNP